MSSRNSLSFGFTLAAIAVFAASCAIVTPTIQHSEPSLHSYRIMVADIDGKPVQGASVTSTLYNHLHRTADSVLNTDEKGEATFTVVAAVDTADYYMNAYETKCEYSVFKIGYLPEYGSTMISYVLTDLNSRGQQGLTEKTVTVPICTVNDLLHSEIAGMEDTSAKNILCRFIEAVHNQYDSKGMVIPPHTLAIAPKDGIRYLSVQIQTGQIMNSDMLDDDGFARTFFTVAGRPTIELLRNDADQLKIIDGFDLTLSGEKKHFMKSGDKAVPLECRYFIPKELFHSVDSTTADWKFLQASRILLDGSPVTLTQR